LTVKGEEDDSSQGVGPSPTSGFGQMPSAPLKSTTR